MSVKLLALSDIGGGAQKRPEKVFSRHVPQTLMQDKACSRKDSLIVSARDISIYAGLEPCLSVATDLGESRRSALCRAIG